MRNNIRLAFSFAKRDFKERYVGTGLGQLWYIISPIIMIFIYTVIFSDFMKMKLNIIDNTYAYSIYIVPGLLSWISFSKVISLLSNMIAQKSNLIKKINTPIYVFFLSLGITEFILLILSMFFGIVFLLLIDYPIGLSFIWLLPIMFLQMIFAFSFGVIIALLVPFIKDLKEAIPIAIQLWFWATPIIYLKDKVLQKYPLILDFNPFFHFVHLYQDIFLYSKIPSFQELLLITSISFSTLFLAAYLYKKMVNTIKDII